MNCNKLLHGENYCPQCGQLNNQHKQGVFEYIGSSFAYIFGADSRLLSTLPLLFFQPGVLATKYNAGQRDRYVPPLRLFIWLLLMIVIWQKFNLIGNDSNSQSIILNQSQTDSSYVDDSTGVNIDLGETNEDAIAEYAIAKPEVSELDGLAHLNLEPSIMNRLTYRFFRSFGKLNRGTFLRAFLDKLLFILLIFTPFFGVWLKLLYLRKRSFYLLDHLVFILFNHSFLLLLLLLGLVLELWISFQSLSWILLIYVIYLWISFRNFYKQKWTKQIIKFFLAGVGFCGLASIFLLIKAILAILFD